MQLGIYIVLQLCYIVYFMIVGIISYRLGLGHPSRQEGGGDKLPDIHIDVATYRLNRSRCGFRENERI